MAKTIDLPLTELYNRKITTSVEAAIRSKENFTELVPEYCEKVCKLKCKRPEGVVLLDSKQLDILIIQDHAAPKGPWDRNERQQEKIQQGILEFICQKAGFQGLSYRITSLLKCFPDERDFIKGKSPPITTISKCKPYLAAEIQRTNPRVIISLSTAVTKALGYAKHSNTGNRGEIIDNIIITLHPRVLSMIRQNASGVMWGNDYFEVIRRDFQKAADIVRGRLVIKPLNQGVEEQKKNVTICKDLESVRKTVDLILNLPEGQLISCDTETTGLDGMAPDAKILCIQFGWKDGATGNNVAVVIPLWHRDNKWFNPDVAWKLIIPLLVNKGLNLVFHNGKFDILYIYHTKKVRVENFAMDTMLLLHALDSGSQGCLSLKAAIWDFAPDLGIGGYENLLPGLTKKKKNEDLEDEENGD